MIPCPGPTTTTTCPVFQTVTVMSVCLVFPDHLLVNGRGLIPQQVFVAPTSPLQRSKRGVAAKEGASGQHQAWRRRIPSGQISPV